MVHIAISIARSIPRVACTSETISIGISIAVAIRYIMAISLARVGVQCGPEPMQPHLTQRTGIIVGPLLSGSWLDLVSM